MSSLVAFRDFLVFVFVIVIVIHVVFFGSSAFRLDLDLEFVVGF